MRASSNRALQRGFTLLEMLVAFTILVMAFSVVLRVFSAGARSTGLADRHSRAVVHAEVLVSLVLLSTVMVAVYGALRMGMRSWEAVEERSAAATAERVVRNLLSRQARLLVPLVTEQRSPALVLFNGERDRLRFVAPLAHASRGEGLYVVELALRNRRGDVEPVLRYRLRDPEADGLEVARAEPIERVLPLVLDTARFDYYGAPEPGQPDRWLGNWPREARQYPRLVRLRGTLPDGREWPALVLSIPAQAEAGS